jgi:site-specific DNA-methyltransferase (adenine-specific)
MSGRDAHDLAIMRRELHASRRVDGSIVAHDIRGRRHEANVAAQWITTRTRKHKEARTKGEQFNEAVYLREYLEVSISTMQTWIVILRNWSLYARRREAAGVTGYSGASYARSLVQDGFDEAVTSPRASGNRFVHVHDRLKNAAARAAHLQGLYEALCRKTGEVLVEQPTPVRRMASIKPTVRLPFAELYHADCLGVMSSLPPESVDLAIWDLPFGVTSASWDEPIDLSMLWTQMLRLLKPHGVVLAFAVQPLSSRLVSSQPELYRCQWHRLIANSSNFLRTDIYPLRVIEDILMFSPSGQFTYTPPREAIDSPYRVPIRPHKSRIYRLSAKMYNSFAGTRQEGATPISLLDFPFEPGEQQIETQKPVKLLGYLIETYTNTGATVLDPTAGAFSTGMACWNTGRRFIGIEKLAKHFHIGVDRLRQLTAASDAENLAAAD